MLVLAAQSAQGSGLQVLFESLPWLGVAIAVVVAGSLLIMWARRRVRGLGTDTGQSEVVNLSTFRELHERGEISDKEYAAIRENMARRAKRDLGT